MVNALSIEDRFGGERNNQSWLGTRGISRHSRDGLY